VTKYHVLSQGPVKVDKNQRYVDSMGTRLESNHLNNISILNLVDRQKKRWSGGETLLANQFHKEISRWIVRTAMMWLPKRKVAKKARKRLYITYHIEEKATL
jgi:hypothetical protein